MCGGAAAINDEDFSWCPEDCEGQCDIACQGKGCITQPCPAGKTTDEECNCVDDGK